MDVITSWTGARADALRQALRMTNETFAERLGVAVRTVAYWRERSASVPQPAMQEALDTVLAQAPELARAQFWLILAEREGGAGSPQAPLAAAALRHRYDGPGRGPSHGGPSPPPRGEGVCAPPGSGTRLVTPGDVRRARSMRWHLKAIDNAHGGAAALPMAVGYLRAEVLPLLSGIDGGPAARGVLEAIAEYEHDIGWMAYDAGRQDAAGRYFASALRRAESAGNRMLTGRILAAMSHHAIHLGRVRRGVELAQAARRVTARVASPRAAAMEAAMEACAHAAAGDSRQSHRALGEAADAVTRITAGDQPDPGWLDFDEGGYWGHAARACRDLGELSRAEESARKAVTLCLPGHDRTLAQRTIIRATAHLGMGELEAAITAAERVVSQAWTLHSAHVLGEVAQLAAAITALRSPAASGFLDQAGELLTARARPAGPPPSC